jgi:hypothetical protein
MKLNLELSDGSVFSASFKRIKTANRDLLDAMNSYPQVDLFKIQGALHCGAYHSGPHEDAGRGYAFCSNSEPGGFDWAKGRRVALTDAIKNFDRSTRVEIWEAYNEKFPPAREKRRKVPTAQSMIGNYFFHHLDGDLNNNTPSNLRITDLHGRITNG